MAKKQAIVKEIPEDIVSYIGQYNEDIQWMKLKSMAFEIRSLSSVCLDKAIDLAKEAGKVGFIIEIYNQVEKNPIFKEVTIQTMDRGWIRKQEQDYKKLSQKKEQDIQKAIASHIRESVRLEYKEAADAAWNYGYYLNAYKLFSKSFDVSMDTEDSIIAAIGACKASIGIENYSYYYRFCENVVDLECKDPNKKQLLTGLHALGLMMHERYTQAVYVFLKLSPEHLEVLSSILTLPDIICCLTLCILATTSRPEMQSLAKHTNFLNLLEATPEYQNIIPDFLNSQYLEFSSAMSEIPINLQYDVGLMSKVHALNEKIYERAIAQYILPYKTIDLNRMKDELGLTMEILELRLVEMAAKEIIKVRVDSHNKILYAKEDDKTSSCFKTAIASGKKFISDTEEALLRLMMEKNELGVKRPAASGDLQSHIIGQLGDMGQDIY